MCMRKRREHNGQGLQMRQRRHRQREMLIKEEAKLKTSPASSASLRLYRQLWILLFIPSKASPSLFCPLSFHSSSLSLTSFQNQIFNWQIRMIALCIFLLWDSARWNKQHQKKASRSVAWRKLELSIVIYDMKEKLGRDLFVCPQTSILLACQQTRPSERWAQ